LTTKLPTLFSSADAGAAARSVAAMAQANLMQTT
jgi:hypothetical protein